ncbi:MAG: hypothetical protein PHX78_04640 [bacterium]|nr:hypothetical protein [bacterium]
MAVNNRILRDFRRFQKASCIRKSSREYFSSSGNKIPPSPAKAKNPQAATGTVDKASDKLPAKN